MRLLKPKNTSGPLYCLQAQKLLRRSVEGKCQKKKRSRNVIFPSPFGYCCEELNQPVSDCPPLVVDQPEAEQEGGVEGVHGGDRAATEGPDGQQGEERGLPRQRQLPGE